VMTDEKQILFLATANPHKLAEMKAIVGVDRWDLRMVNELMDPPHWDETGKTFRENATIKASTLADLCDECVLADDSGLIVDYLQGEPGILSSRYAGDSASDTENNQKLLANLKGVAKEKRSARFVCNIAFIDKNKKVSNFEGTCEGIILENLRGDQGFGYDPLFYYAPFAKTLAELTPEEKNLVSHRAKALKAWAKSGRIRG